MFSLNPIGKRFGQHCLIMFSSFILNLIAISQSMGTREYFYCLMLCLLLLMLRISTTSDPTISPGSEGLIVNYNGRDANCFHYWWSVKKYITDRVSMRILRLPLHTI